MVDLPLGFQGEFTQRLKGSLQFIVTVKIFLRIFFGCKVGIQRDPNLLIGILVQAFEFLFTACQFVSIGIEKLAVYPVLFALFCIL